MRKTRVKYSTILLLFVFCLLPVLTVLTIHHISLTDCLIKMGTGCFGDSYATLTAHDLKSYNDILDPLQTFQSKWAVYEDKTDSNGTIRKIFFNKEYVNLPMESGRFFKASDFEIGNKVAVIGKNKKNEVHEKDGVQYITVEESEYVVIGVIGFENETIIDNYDALINYLAFFIMRKVRINYTNAPGLTSYFIFVPTQVLNEVLTYFKKNYE